MILERFRLEDVQRSPAFFDVKKLSHMNGVYLRELSVDDFVAAARPWVDPVPGEWAPGGWLDPDTGAPAVSPPAWAPERFDAGVFAALAEVTQERVTVLGEVPELVDFLFLADAPDDPDSLQKAIAGDEGAAQILADALAAYEVCPWDKDALHEVTLAIAEAVGRKLGKAQAPIRVAVMGRTRGLPLFDSLAVLGRDETRRRLAAALGSRDACPLMLLAPLRWALRIAALVVAAIVLYFGVTLVQVWLTSRQYDPHPAGAILVMGAAQDDCVPTPDLRGAPGPGGDALPPGLRPPDHADGQQAAGRQVHRGAVGCHVSREIKGVPSSAILQAGGNDSYENIADAQAALLAHGAKVVLVTTDPFHEDRSMAIASDLGLTPSPTPTQSSPITGWSTVPYFVKEAIGVGLGRIIGYNHLEWLHDA